MLLSTLQKVSQIIQQTHLLTSNELDAFISRLSRVDAIKAPWIYPGAFRRDTGILIETIYKVLLAIEKEGIIRSYIEVQCPVCNRSTGCVYPSLSDIPKEITCRYCDSEVVGASNYIIVYKAIE